MINPILIFATCMAVMSCSTIGLNSREASLSEREFTVKVINVSDNIQSIGLYVYQDKKEILGLSSKALYEVSLNQTLAVGESYLFETDRNGVAITYNYKAEDAFYGKRSRWRPGDNRKIHIEYEFRNKNEGTLVQTSEE